jgi:hypothetical protein
MLGSLTLDQQLQDHHDHAQNSPTALNDFVSPVLDIAGPRMTAEAHARGLSCAGELDQETCEAIYEQARVDWVAQNGPEPSRGPTPVAETPAGLRNDWLIPPEVRRQVMTRLHDMADPAGTEGAALPVRERLMAARVLGRFGALSAAQQRLDRRIQAAGPIPDWDRLRAEAEESDRLRIAQRKQEDAERQRPESTGAVRQC